MTTSFNPNIQPREPILIGSLVGCHGIRGAIKLLTTGDEPDWVDDLETIYLCPKHMTLEAAFKTGKVKTATITDARIQGLRKVLIQLEGVEDRNAAEPWVGLAVYAEKDDLPELPEGEFRAQELSGLTVISQETGRTLGTVVGFLSAASGGQDFLEIEVLDESGKPAADTAVVPFVPEFFPEVDLEARQIRVEKLDEFLVEFLTAPPPKPKANRPPRPRKKKKSKPSSGGSPSP